jgi:hypothetical protein
MSENNFLIDLSKSIKVPADLTKAALEPPAKQIGEGLGDLFYIAFSPIAKARIKKEVEIQKFREEIENELSTIHPEKLCEPKLNIVGPAFEAAKYYIEDEELRSMFAKLIASSMSIDSNDKTHSSFVEIIKQLSSFDAKNFKYLFANTHLHIAVGKIKTANEDGGENTIIDNFFPFPDLNMDNQALYSSSIDNLIRLGLIQIDHHLHYTIDSRYDPLLSHPIFIAYENIINARNMLEQKNKKVFLKKSIWDFTSFGKQFGQCCL